MEGSEIWISFRRVLISFRRTLNSFHASWRLERGAASTRFGVAALQRNVLLLQHPRAASARPPRRPSAGGSRLSGLPSLIRTPACFAALCYKRSRAFAYRGDGGMRKREL